MKNSKIEWCHHTLNLWWGCIEVHAGCDNCYARILAHRYGYDVWGKNSLRREIKSWEAKLKEFQRLAQASGETHRVFIGSMMDIFEKPQPIIGKDYTTSALRDKLFLELVPQCPNLEFLLLTKRPSNINKYIPEAWKTNPPSNVIFGTSPVNQETADMLVPQLLEVKGRRFLSVEPQLDHVDLKPWLKEIGQVIVGGESGHGKRPFNPDWARFLRDQCKAAGTPFFMKQWDKIKEIPEDLMIREFPVINNHKNNNQKSTEMKTSPKKNAMKEIVSKLSPFKKEIGEALINGENPEALAIRLAEKRAMPVPTAQAYVTMVRKLFDKLETEAPRSQRNKLPIKEEVTYDTAKKESDVQHVTIDAQEGDVTTIKFEITINLKNI